MPAPLLPRQLRARQAETGTGSSHAQKPVFGSEGRRREGNLFRTPRLHVYDQFPTEGICSVPVSSAGQAAGLLQRFATSAVPGIFFGFLYFFFFSRLMS